MEHRSRLVVVVLLCAAFILTGLNARAASSRELQKKVEALEQKVNKLETETVRSKSVGTFFSEHITIGGFFEHAASAHFSKEHKTLLSADTNILGINLGATLNDKFRFTAQQLTILSFPLANEHNATLRAHAATPTIAAFVAHAYGDFSC